MRCLIRSKFSLTALLTSQELANQLAHLGGPYIHELEILLYEASCLDYPDLNWHQFRIKSRTESGFALSLSGYEKLLTWVNRRANHEPMAYILNKQEFMAEEFYVDSSVLIPRPETEVIVNAVLDLYPNNQNKYILELGTGSGAIAISIAKQRHNWFILAVDISYAAIQIAVLNQNKILDKLLPKKNLYFSQGDWQHGFCGLAENFLWDAIISNPPYIDKADQYQDTQALNFEPQQALYSADDGLYDLKYIIKNASKYLKPNGYLLLEHGFQQARDIRQEFMLAKFQNIFTLQDRHGLDRITLGENIGSMSAV